jgi:hypothetical protein
LGRILPESDRKLCPVGWIMGRVVGGNDLFRGLAMNLKQGGGRVPIRDDDGYRLVAMPDREAFDAMLPRRTQEILDRMWSIINMRLSGQTLAAVAKEHGVSIERVRQIEAHFQRKLASHLSTLS